MGQMFEKGVALVYARKWDIHGGIENYATTLAGMLPQAHPDQQAVLVDSRGSGSLLASVFQVIRAGRDLRRLARDGRIDVVHINMSERASFFRKGYLVQLARSAGLRVILHHHGADLVSSYEALPAPAKAFVRGAVKSADVNVVLGSETGQWLTDRMGLPSDRWQVVYNALPDLPTPPEPLPEAPDRPFRPLLLAVLSDRKGVKEYLEALAALKARGTAFEATVAGGGPELERFQAMAATLGIADDCTFPGWVKPEDVPPMLTRHDVYVLPSHAEGLPIGILEALRQGRAVITTTVGAIPEALPAGPDMALVPPGDVPALTEALANMAADPAQRRVAGQTARTRYEQNFTFEAHLNQMVSLYRGHATDQAVDVAADLPEGAPS
ncbi:MAG: glycosyltransferase family 4 protein [Pseudomonadota bacterium]